MTNTSQDTLEDGIKSATLKLPTSRLRFDRAKTEKLRTEHAKALAANNRGFFFEGNELLTAYAGYMLEYLDAKLK